MYILTRGKVTHCIIYNLQFTIYNLLFTIYYLQFTMSQCHNFSISQFPDFVMMTPAKRPNKVQKSNNDETSDTYVDFLNFLVIYLQLMSNYKCKTNKCDNLPFGLAKSDIVSLVLTNKSTFDCYLNKLTFNWTFNVEMWPEYIKSIGCGFDKNLIHFNKLVVTNWMLDCGVIRKCTLLLFKDLRKIETTESSAFIKVTAMLQRLYKANKLKQG